MSDEERKAMDNEMQNISLGIIASSGQARSLAFQALAKARGGHIDEAHALLEESKRAALKAHECQTHLLTREASGEHIEIDVLLVHAQDHLMTSMLAQELIEELIILHETKADRREEDI
ncbi:PTS lactose/cellobiose transporter subunit IIA [Thermophilibacter immobilis]|jgi:PTS system cellobiose-specific IIA component|uniref:PTS lactose/cellobiose transporter subunit IIA n=1 Tax=Thermophilibacter immobilis TaxID=2779519 RepID=A0A7S7M6S7_9ACTN|nr:PTS lactose/cellobiose transporter subunit IIA [Thermophilibacter immobilis]QOY59814.1 PTS lactose/cellobiose transporter subunit IIA [Thermophilibacter immobilis]